MFEQIANHPSLVQAQKQADQKAKNEELKRKQINGEIKKIPANKDPNHEIWETEKDFYHVRLSKKHWQDDIRDILWEHIVHSCTPRDFAMLIKDPVFKSYDKQEILHDPTIKEEVKQTKDKEVPETLKAARAQYKELTGKKPGNKKEATLTAEINKILDKQTEEK